jgi:two-component system OmpR family response regulator
VTGSGTTRRVLVVDDDIAIHDLATVALETVAGWEVLSAHNAEGALQIARSQPVDVVLLDLEMPGTDGPAILHRLKNDERTRNIPVIFLTASKPGNSKHHDVVAYLAKPFDPTKLANQVAHAMGWL